MTAHIADLERKLENPKPVQRFSAQESRQRKPVSCYRCGEEGHMSMNCRSETRRTAEPSNHTRNQAAVVCEIFESSSDEEEYYPAKGSRRPGRPKKILPYNKGDKGKRREQTPPVIITRRSRELDTPINSEMEDFNNAAT